MNFSLTPSLGRDRAALVPQCPSRTLRSRAMSVVTEQVTHRRHVEVVIEASQGLAEQVSSIALSLAEDGAQPRFIAALSEFESVLEAERRRLEAALDGRARIDQQELTV